MCVCVCEREREEKKEIESVPVRAEGSECVLVMCDNPKFSASYCPISAVMSELVDQSKPLLYAHCCMSH